VRSPGLQDAHDTLSARSTVPKRMPIALAAAQKRYLRSLAHDLKPVILVGAKGVTPALLAELDLALEHHELVKLKIAAGDRDERDAWVEEIVKATGVALVQRVGNIATVFRARRKNPGIVLPR
jgi:RNA-binding protein